MNEEDWEKEQQEQDWVWEMEEILKEEKNKKSITLFDRTYKLQVTDEVSSGSFFMAMGIRNQKDLEDYLRANKKIVRSDGMEWIWKERGMDERLRRITEFLSKPYEEQEQLTKVRANVKEINPDLIFPQLLKIFYIWVEEKGLIITTEEEYKKWLATDPDMVLFEADIKGIRVETVFEPDVFDEHGVQISVFKTKITRENGESWSRSGSVEEAEKKHILAISNVLKELRKK